MCLFICSDVKILFILSGMTSLVFEIKRLRLRVYLDWSDYDGYVLLSSVHARENDPRFIWMSIWDFKDLISACLIESNDN